MTLVACALSSLDREAGGLVTGFGTKGRAMFFCWASQTLRGAKRTWEVPVTIGRLRAFKIAVEVENGGGSRMRQFAQLLWYRS
jgi:hypothetical protein